MRRIIRCSGYSLAVTRRSLSERASLARWLLFSAIMSSFFVSRGTTGFVWNDTGMMTALLYDSPIKRAPLWFLNGLEYFGQADVADSYRPLSSAIGDIAVGVFGLGPADWRIWLLVCSAIVGATGVAIQAVAARLLNSERWALVVTFLVLCSPAFLTGAWVILVGSQPIVTLMICLGL